MTRPHEASARGASDRAQSSPYAAPTFIPASRLDEPVAFHSLDALALHLLRQRPGRKLDLLSQDCTRNGEPYFPVCAVFTLKPAPRRLQAGRAGDPEGPTRLMDDFLGYAAGPDAFVPELLAAALARMASAGGLAE